MTLAMQIHHNYENFIDTRPSKEKSHLTNKVKSNIETLVLLKEVNIYLGAQK